MTKHPQQTENIQNNIHQKHSLSLNNLLTVPKQQQNIKQNLQQNTQQNIKLNIQHNTKQNTQQQHSPLSINSFCSVGNLSVKTSSSNSSTFFPISTTEQISQITRFPVLLPKEEQICLYSEKNNSISSLAYPSSSKELPLNLTEQQNNNIYNCPTCNNKINVFEQQKPELNDNKSQNAKNKNTKVSKNTKNIIVIPPSSPTSSEQKEANILKITCMPLPERQNNNEGVVDEDSGNNNSHFKLLQQKLFENYHTVAYTLVILTCFLAFCEYLYLRLVSFIFPEPIIYRRKCEKHYNEVVYRNELHFASGLAIFLVMGIFQILCFFLLTISKKVLDVKHTTFSQVLSIEERLHFELVFAVKRTMFATLYPTFAIYLLCSSVIYCVIFYMVGLRDPIVHNGSRIIIYVFDACIILYFLAFPVLCVIFHPEINCCRTSFSRICCCCTCLWRTQRRIRDRANAQQFGNSQSLQTNDEEIVVVAAHPITSTTDNSEETKSESQQANITFNGNNGSINTKHMQQQNFSATLSEDEAISGGNDGRAGSSTGRRQRFSGQQQRINKELPIRTKQQTRIRTKSPMSGSNKNYGSLERRQPLESVNNNYEISSPNSFDNNNFNNGEDKKTKIKNYDKIYNKFNDDNNKLDQITKIEKEENNLTTKNTTKHSNTVINSKRREISTQTEAVRRRLQQRRQQSKYKRLITGSDELIIINGRINNNILNDQENCGNEEKEEKIKRRNNFVNEEEKKNEENGRKKKIKKRLEDEEDKVDKEENKINSKEEEEEELNSKNSLFTQEELSINFKGDLEENENNNNNEEEKEEIFNNYSNKIEYINNKRNKKNNKIIVKC